MGVVGESTSMKSYSKFRFALLGAGRIGVRHAENIATRTDCTLAWVHDADPTTAARVCAEYGGKPADAFEQVVSAGNFDAAIVATPTDTHVDLVIALARAGKPILCEKPLDLDVRRAAACLDVVKDLDVPIQMGFNRRFDAGHAALARAVHGGEIGTLQACIIVSRDFAPPHPGYIERSGGIFRDSSVHDFDMIRFIAREEPVAVSALGSVLFLDDARSHGDADTIAVSLRLASGAVCQISGSRRAPYGHDQRIEVMGEKGMLISPNLTASPLERYTSEMTSARAPFIASSRDRYRQAYRNELAEFIACVREGRQPSVTLEDGYRALVIAEAATRAFHEGTTIEIPAHTASSARTTERDRAPR